MNRKWILILFCAAMAVSAIISSLCRDCPDPVMPEHIDVEEDGFSPRQRPILGTSPARQFSDAIADVVERVMPSVVVVRTEATKRRIKRDYFGFAYPVDEELIGEGSGVIIDERGYVITSRHVLVGAQQVEVVLNDGTKLPARLVGHDETTDLAVLQIKSEGADCPAVQYGDSDRVRVGEVVIAIGSPFSLQSSVTIGHVSQKGRRMQILPYEDFIQIDAAINEGNSGGPLINVDGRLIGINTAIQTDVSERAVGIAFAIPSSLAMVVAKSLIENGKHDWPWVGAAFGSSENQAVVAQVWRDTPAAEAGMQPGDIVLEVDGIKVRNNFDVLRVIFNNPVGETLRFSILRGEEQTLDFDLQLEEFPHQP